MKAKQYLEQLDLIDTRIRVNRECMDEKYLSDTYKQKLKNQTKKYHKAKGIIIEQIKAMPDEMHRVILYQVYVKHRTLKDIASDGGRSYRHIMHRHNEAIEQFEQMNRTLEFLT